MMSANITCPNCKSENDCSEFSREEHLVLYCANCDAELGEVVPKIILIKESFYFLLNAFIYILVIGTSAYAFENYNELKGITGFICLFSFYLASIALHEFSHAFFAYIFGDYTILEKGYLRLNILKYFHGPHSFIMPGIQVLFTGVFLPGAAVYLRLDLIKYRLYKFIAIVSGPFSHLIFLYFLLSLINSSSLNYSNGFAALLHIAAFIQLVMFVINILPIPGLDGWNAIFSLTFERFGNFLSRYLSLPSIALFMYALIFIEEFSLYILDKWDLLLDMFSQINIDLAVTGFDEYMRIIDEDTLKSIQIWLEEIIGKDAVQILNYL